MEMTRELAGNVLEVVDKGLVKGVGIAQSGSMCVEAAVCYAMGLPHGDNPSCVGSAVRSFKIRLNDSNWPSDSDRAKGMRKLAIAQLGSDSIDQWKFANYVALHCQKRIFPVVLRHAASFKSKHSDELESISKELENCNDLEEIKKITLRARKITAYAYADANAYAYACAYAEISHKLLIMLADIGLEALIECKSPGCEFLDLCEVDHAQD